ncbi:type IV secretory system conjugative DNA transfer family protein [Campylobacter hominis]|uniref:Cmgd4 n=1 Tax=Campylobacter hominis (strain ATCC BAA-381 / DSM 21671 / CCUG 45161 / LMG 19568 / NCTC 13146 / CH001A) TaxID=360107 RepID=A7HZT7_CAMHC|nr:type IV secretory system conjugative DNA transfer family protein [Campylobacter hominis]ABS52184.1 cmgd4 [Campylobacter hominis ATCC BAA-381]UAK85364.1 type IV secretory system conjugative DNA transfer family protein [Campylobacter hominis]SUW84328.1 cmgd4 [Campylobacter hominis]
MQDKLNKAQIIFLSIVAIVISYFLTSVVIFVLNDALKLLPKVWKPEFTFLALINGYPKVYEALTISLFLSFSVVFLLPFIPKKEKLYGNARFANSADIRKMGLFPKKGKDGKIDNNGIIIGMYNNQLLRFGGQQFVALGAPTRSGKGVGIVIPNLLDYPNSCVVQDIKLECFEYTSKYRKEILKQDIFLFNPYSFKTHRYNPLFYIDMKGENADAELNDFANILYPLKNDGSVTDYFNGKAKDLFIGLCYMMNDLLGTRKGIAFLQKYELECSFSLYGILKLSEGLNFEVEIADGEIKTISNFADTYNTLVEMKMVSPKAKERIDAFFEIKSDNERSSAMGSFISPLAIFRADNMRLATSANDFDFRDLRRKKMTIYIGITPDKLASAKPILNIFWQQLILINVQQGLPQSNKELKHPCLLLMDEFTASGYLATYSSAISFMAGYDLRSLIIYQADSQLTNNKPEGYGQAEANTLLKNHACRIYYAMKDDDAKRLSESLGTKTVKQRSRNLGQGGGGSESETSRALMLSKEIEEMPFDTEIIKIEGKPPIKCKKALYYSNKYFMDKFKEVSPSLKNIKEIPNRKSLENAIQNGETYIKIPLQNEETLQNYLKENIEKRLNELPIEEDAEIENALDNINIEDEEYNSDEYENFETRGNL